MKKLLAGILATSVLATVAISASAVDYTVDMDKNVTGEATNPMVELPSVGGVPYGQFNLESDDTVTIPMTGNIGNFGGGGDDKEIIPPYETSAISISMPLRLAFGNYSDAKPGATFALSQENNQFYSAEYSIINNTLANVNDATKTGEVTVSVVGATKTGSGITLLDVVAGQAQGTYANNAMAVGVKVESGFTETAIDSELAIATGTYKNGATPTNTADLNKLINTADNTKVFTLGKLAAASNATGDVVGTTGKFKILGDASNKFPTNKITDNFTVTFKFETP